MKKTSTYLLTVVLTIFLTTTSNAQSYKTGIGVRGGVFSGLTVKHFIGADNAIEGILSSKWGGFTIVGLLEIHKETEISNLKWFYGFGAHIGNYDRYEFYYRPAYMSPNNYYSGNVATFGIDGILGAEYRFQEIPITLGVDVKPFLDVVHNGGGFFDTVLAARYVF